MFGSKLPVQNTGMIETSSHRYVAYLAELVGSRKSALEVLERVEMELAGGRNINPATLFGEDIPARSIAMKTFELLIQQRDFSREEAIKHIRLLVENMKGSVVRESEAYEEITLYSRPLEFGKLPQRSVRSVYPDYGHPTRIPQVRNISLPYQIEASLVVVSQGEFVRRVGKNPVSENKLKSERQMPVVVPIDNKLIHFQPDIQVVNYDYVSAVVYMNELSIQKGLKPVYLQSNGSPWLRADFSAVEKQGTRLDPWKDIVINAPGGDIRRAEGYRFPTPEETVYFLSLAAEEIVGGGIKTALSYLPSNLVNAFEKMFVAEDQWAGFEWAAIFEQPVWDGPLVRIDGHDFRSAFGSIGLAYDNQQPGGFVHISVFNYLVKHKFPKFTQTELTPNEIVNRNYPLRPVRTVRD